MTKRDAAKFVLARFEGAVTKRHKAQKTELAQRAKVGDCPRCTRATHVAIPPMCELSEYGWMKDVVRVPTKDWRLANM